MKEPSENPKDWKALRDELVGLGNTSIRKTYYPDLQQQVHELERSEARFRAIFDSVSDAIFVHDAETGEILDVNPRGCSLWGYTRDDILASDVGILSSGDPEYTQERAMELIGRTLAGEPQVAEWRMRDRDGHLRWLEVRLVRASIAGSMRVIVVAHDITEEKEARQALVDREAQLRTLINAMPDIVCFKDGDGRWLEANEFDLNLFQLNGVDYQGLTDRELAEFSTFCSDALLKCEAWKLGRPSRQDEVIPTPDGEARVFDVFKVPTYNPDGNRRGLVVIGRDITERKKAEEECRALEEHKRRFYRDTILSVTDGRLTICEAGETDAYLSTTRMTIPVLQPGDARAARRSVAEVIRLPDDDLGEFIVAVGEAISNALKHADSGTVYAGRNDDEAWAAVEDHGRGIESIILPSAVLRRGFSTKPSLGLGFSIMLAAADRILLNTGTSGTTLVLVKSLHPVPPLFGGDLWKGALDLSAL
jgi:PAS domain S-box-containing protein